MSAVSAKAAIREMDRDELQEYANELFTKCQGDVLLLSEKEHRELCECSNNYFSITGENLQPQITRVKFI